MTFPEHRELLGAAARLEQALGRFAGDQSGLARARHILTESAAWCHTVADALFTDPTLATEPTCSARFRSVDLLTELTRMLLPLLRIAELDPTRSDQDRQERRAEAEALFARLGELAADAFATVARADSATEAGSRAISRDRLAGRSGDLREAADIVHGAVAAALRLPHPDPCAVELAALAECLHRHAEALAGMHAAESGAGLR